MRRYFIIGGCGFVVLSAFMFGIIPLLHADPETTFAMDMRAFSDFSRQMEIYQKLLEKVGPERAQEILVATMPIDAKTHMLDHETGRFLYRTRGVSGIVGCKPDFAGACYHGFLTAMLVDRGAGSAPELFAECVKGLAKDQSLDCAHGIGHAFLAVAGYAHLPDALASCDAQFGAATDAANRSNCYNGVFMENSFGEFNAPPSDRWYKPDDPMYPCNAPSIRAYPGAHAACWFTQSQKTLNEYAYPQLGGDMRAVEQYCGSLNDASDAGMCFKAIGLQIQHMNGDDPEKIRAACAALSDAHRMQCVWDAAGTAYYFGDRASSSWVLHVCEAETDRKDECYESLFSYFALSLGNIEGRLAACAAVPEAASGEKCVAWMHSPALDRTLDFGSFDH